MEITTIDKDITVFYVTASSYPEGIMDARENLHSRVPFSTDRKYFGISRPEEGGDIVYRAAAEELTPGEGKQFGCDTVVLKKGRYVYIRLNNYMDDLTGVGRAFDELLTHPDIDPQGYCVEWYLSQKDVQCMVRLED